MSQGQTVDVEASEMPSCETYEHPEGWARLQGLMAMLSLPEVRRPDGTFGKRRVEVRVAPNVWRVIDSVCIEADAITYSWGVNGTREEWRFDRAREGIPLWRMETPQPVAAYIIS